MAFKRLDDSGELVRNVVTCPCVLSARPACPFWCARGVLGHAAGMHVTRRRPDCPEHGRCDDRQGSVGRPPQNVVTGGSPFTVGMFVHPSAIPSGAGTQFVASRNVGNSRRDRSISSSGWSKPAQGAPVVKASADGAPAPLGNWGRRGCTGS